jgi:hypothetical protein
MPYGPGDTVKAAGASKYKGKALRAFKHAFNSCHAKGHEESRCFKIAHHAAKNAGKGE